MHFVTPGLVSTRTILLLALLSTIPVTMAGGNDCPAILPADAGAISELRLCRVSAAGADEFSVCRDYSDDRRIYQIVFRGGTTPLAVYESAGASLRSGASALEGARRAVGNRRCDLERPQGVPAAAAYRGTGVCHDELGRSLPCSLFEHAGARQPEAMRYFVYYEPDGSGVRRIDALPAGHNEHVLEAELAFQLGQALSRTECCSRRAQAYLTHAAALFPDDGTYRAAVIAIRSSDTKAQSSPMAAFRRMLNSSP